MGLSKPPARFQISRLPEGCTKLAGIDREGGSCAKRQVGRDKCCSSAEPTVTAPRYLCVAPEPSEGTREAQSYARRGLASLTRYMRDRPSEGKTCISG